MCAADPTLVILAAGLGTRFGGMKPLAPVTVDGATIMDVLIDRAAATGFGRIVIVVAPGMEGAVRAHVDAHRRPTGIFPADPIPVELVGQPLRPGHAKPLGTAEAVLRAQDAVGGSFVVVNADDLYPADAFGRIAGHLRTGPTDEHAMVAFRVIRTLVGSKPVSRALVELDIDDDSRLAAIREGAVTHDADGLRFAARTGPPVRLSPDRIVSMNMWGFRETIFDALARAVDEFVDEERQGDIYLPNVVGSIVLAGATVRVLISEGVCIGVTHPEDVVAVREVLA